MKQAKKNNKSKAAGRNVANISQLKAAINDYCTQKKLPEAISSWLNKTFLRWLVNSFKEVQPLSSKERFTQLVGEAAPDWFVQKIKTEKFIYINPKDPDLLEILDKSAEWLGSKYPQLVHKFPKMTVFHVLKKWQKDHDYMKRKRANTIETSGAGLVTSYIHPKEASGEQYRIVEMLPNHAELRFEMARESSYMQHCLGEFDDIAKAEGGYGSYYYKQIKEQSLRLFSLRDKKNKPHATIALMSDDEELWVDQIKGKQNTSPVSRYVPTVQGFLNQFHVQYDYHSDCLGMGLLFEKGKSLSIAEVEDENTQQLLLSYDARLAGKMKAPSRALVWLAVLKQPSNIKILDNVTEPMKIAALIQQPLLMTELTFSSGARPRDILKGIKQFNLGKRLIRFMKLQPRNI